ncbi:MAG: hypothetical protein OXD50_14450 [Chloroflexi bacterium]|nr:hypothetical protein [Chloroflexota bacterium]
MTTSQAKAPSPAELRRRMAIQLYEEMREQSSADDGNTLQAAATITSGMSLNEIRISLGIWPNTVDAAT